MTDHRDGSLVSISVHSTLFHPPHPPVTFGHCGPKSHCSPYSPVTSQTSDNSRTNTPLLSLLPPPRPPSRPVDGTSTNRRRDLKRPPLSQRSHLTSIGVRRLEGDDSTTTNAPFKTKTRGSESLRQTKGLGGSEGVRSQQRGLWTSALDTPKDPGHRRRGNETPFLQSPPLPSRGKVTTSRGNSPTKLSLLEASYKGDRLTLTELDTTPSKKENLFPLYRGLSGEVLRDTLHVLRGEGLLSGRIHVRVCQSQG